METLSYYIGKEREIEIGEEYYLGQLWDGSGDVEGYHRGRWARVRLGRRRRGRHAGDRVDLPTRNWTKRLMDTVVTVTDIF